MNIISRDSGQIIGRELKEGMHFASNIIEVSLCLLTRNLTKDETENTLWYPFVKAPRAKMLNFNGKNSKSHNECSQWLDRYHCMQKIANHKRSLRE